MLTRSDFGADSARNSDQRGSCRWSEFLRVLRCRDWDEVAARAAYRAARVKFERMSALRKNVALQLAIGCFFLEPLELADP